MKVMHRTSWISRLGNELRALRPSLYELTPESMAEFDHALHHFDNRKVTLTFAGRFKTGKSSMLDAAIGEKLLPTGDLSETGVACVLSKGERRRAVVVHRESLNNSGAPAAEWCQDIPCEMQSIRDAVTLRGKEDRVDALKRTDRVEISLPTFLGGDGASWIDAPGLCDVPEMIARARAAIDQADVVLWVLGSQQFLGEEEVGEIAEHISRRGWISVVFVENAFLSKEHHDPWNYHLEKIAPVNYSKLKHEAAACGFPENRSPGMLTVSAKLALESSYAPGSDKLAEMLISLSNANSPRIIAARTQWLLRILEEIAAKLQGIVARVKEQNGRLAKAASDAQIAREKALNALRNEIKDAVGAYLMGVESAILASGSSVAGGVSKENYKTDNTYTNQLQTRIKGDVQNQAQKLLKRLDDALSASKQGPLVKDDCARITEVISPKNYLSVSVANEDASGAKAAGLVVGGAIGLIFGFGLASGPLAYMGSKVAGALSSVGDANVAKTRADIGVTARCTFNSIKQDAIVLEVTQICTAYIPAFQQILVDRGRENRLETLNVRLMQTAQTCKMNLYDIIANLD